MSIELCDQNLCKCFKSFSTYYWLQLWKHQRRRSRRWSKNSLVWEEAKLFSQKNEIFSSPLPTFDVLTPSEESSPSSWKRQFVVERVRWSVWPDAKFKSCTNFCKSSPKILYLLVWVLYLLVCVLYLLVYALYLLVYSIKYGILSSSWLFHGFEQKRFKKERFRTFFVRTLLPSVLLQWPSPLIKPLFRIRWRFGAKDDPPTSVLEWTKSRGNIKGAGRKWRHSKWLVGQKVKFCQTWAWPFV